VGFRFCATVCDVRSPPLNAQAADNEAVPCLKRRAFGSSLLAQCNEAPVQPDISASTCHEGIEMNVSNSHAMSRYAEYGQAAISAAGQPSHGAKKQDTHWPPGDLPDRGRLCPYGSKPDYGFFGRYGCDPTTNARAPAAF
jgi:hypothetical protein